MKLPRLVRRFESRLWSGWPERAYRSDVYQQRLAAVQASLVECLDHAPAGRLRLISVCAGDGRDVIGVLQTHPRRSDVAAYLVELDGRSVAAGERAARRAGLANSVTFLHGDATLSATYRAIGPAEVVVACGVWGHVPPSERTNFVRALASLCAPGAGVIWSRGGSPENDRFAEIHSLFASPTWEAGQVRFTPNGKWGVAIHRYRGEPAARFESEPMFRFARCAG